MNRFVEHNHSHLYTLRLWTEDTEQGQVEWRGKVQHVPGGESRYFRDWPTLIAFLTAQPGGTIGQPQAESIEAQQFNSISPDQPGATR